MKRNHAKEWKRWRVKHKFTKKSLAFTLGITRRTIYNIESKRTKPSISVRTKFRELVGRYEEESKNGTHRRTK